MKKLQNLGKQLTKDEQKKITGGARVVCACADGTAYICVGGLVACGVDAIKTCHGNATCFAQT